MNCFSFILLIFVVTISFSILFIRIYSIFRRFIPQNHVRKELNESLLCFNEDLILKLQREQWNKAKEEVLGIKDWTNIQAKDMTFYRKSFGTVDLRLNQVAKNHETLVYYRLFKNANDLIRSLITQYGYHLDNQDYLFKAQNCFKEDCSHRKVHYLSHSDLKNKYFSIRHKRFPFTFVREPILRFISGMTEIEYRIKENNITNIPFKAEVGTTQRFIEFVNFLLLSEGSAKLYSEYPSLETIHITPMIGALSLASRVEATQLKFYKVENFSVEWEKMTNDMGVKKLNDLFTQRSKDQLNFHPSSYDPLNTTYAAKSFLSHGSFEAFTMFNKDRNKSFETIIPVNSSVGDYQHLAKGYLRALCRIYLVDYKCFGYQLPSDCQDLNEELMDYLETYQAYETLKKKDIDTSLSLRTYLPHSILVFITNILCVYSKTPECDINILYGQMQETPDFHDEL